MTTFPIYYRNMETQKPCDKFCTLQLLMAYLLQKLINIMNISWI